jgi:phospholipase C
VPPAVDHALDHFVLVLFENRSFDNLLGHLYQPGEVPSFQGVIGKNLSNPIPGWAAHGAEHGVVPFAVASGMDSPNPDPGEEYQHTNTQLFNIINEANRNKDATEWCHPSMRRTRVRSPPWTGSWPTTSASSPRKWVSNRPTTTIGRS